MGNRPKLVSKAATYSAVLASTLALLGTPAIAEQLAEKKTKVVAGQKLTFIKYVNDEGEVRSEVRDARGRRLAERDVRPAKPQIVDPRVLRALEQLERSGRSDSKIRVEIALDLPEPQIKEKPESGEAEVLEGLTIRGAINGQEMTEEALDAHAEKFAREQAAIRAQRNKARAAQLRDWASGHGLAENKGVQQAIAQGREGATLDLTPEQLRRLIKSGDEAIVGIELYEPGEDDIAQAMADTNITNWALPFSSTRGDDIGIYMTESGCAADSRFTNYDRLAGSETNHSRNVGGIIRTVSPDSFLYCRGSAVLPQNSDLDGVGGNPAIYVATRSNSNNDSTSYDTTDRAWDNFVYDKYVATFNSGGNTGNGTGNVRSPGKGLNIITVGNYNDANDTIVSSSPFVDPQTGNDKPEIVSPGANISAGGFTMSGTSQATPHAAAFSADMMSSSTYLKYKPYLAKAKLLAGATDPVAGGYSKVGLGGIDFLSAQYSGYWQWYSGGNGSFGYFDEQDGNSDGFVEKSIYIASSWDRARVVLSWLNRGSYTYSHRNDAHPIGMDLDLRVYDPAGNYVGGSYSWDNPFERVAFQPTVSGYYRFKINRYANRDSSSAVRMGMYVNYYND